MSRQPVRVQIFNQTYTLLADGDAREVQEIADQVDALMVSIADKTGSSDAARLAVLACLHMADKLRTAEKQLQLFEDKSDRIASMLEEALKQAS